MMAKFVQISKCCEIHDIDRHCELPSSLELSDGSSCKHFLKLHIQSSSIELILCLYCNLLLVCPLHLLDFLGNLQPITWKQSRCLESEFWTVRVEWKHQDSLVLGQNSFWCYISHPKSSSFASRRCGCLWNSLGTSLNGDLRGKAGFCLLEGG